MITVQHTQADRCLAAAHSLSFGDEIVAAFNSAKRLGGIVKMSNIDSQHPTVHLSGQQHNALTATWWTLNQYIDSQATADGVFSVLAEMGLSVSAVDARALALRTVIPEGGFPF